MKKIVTMVFALGTFASINANTVQKSNIDEFVVGRLCHEIAVHYANSTGTTGAAYAAAYLSTYNECENHW